jgi:hypothetical protein
MAELGALLGEGKEGANDPAGLLGSVRKLSATPRAPKSDLALNAELPPSVKVATPGTFRPAFEYGSVRGCSALPKSSFPTSAAGLTAFTGASAAPGRACKI